MPTKSIEKVATGLMLLRDGLGPYVEREISVALRSGRLSKADLAKHANDPDLQDRRIRDWDVAPLLRIMFAVWNDVFRESHGPSERSLVSELRTWRNRWAHQDRLTDDDVDRILDSIERLLAAVGASEAKRARTIKDALRRARYSGDVTTEAEEPVAKRAATAAPTKTSTTRTAKKAVKKAPAKRAAVERATVRSGEVDAADRAYKVVCWMKPEEAQVIAEAYEAAETVRTTTSAGTEVEAVWYGSDHPDAITYRAGVCMLRHRRSGDPRRMWIREEEALAVITAYELGETVEYEHEQHGVGGRAVHHPDDAPEVRKYLANVMLTRFR